MLRASATLSSNHLSRLRRLSSSTDRKWTDVDAASTSAPTRSQPSVVVAVEASVIVEAVVDSAVAVEEVETVEAEVVAVAETAVVEVEVAEAVVVEEPESVLEPRSLSSPTTDSKESTS